jgi:hypothetical protein
MSQVHSVTYVPVHSPLSEVCPPCFREAHPLDFFRVVGQAKQQEAVWPRHTTQLRLCAERELPAAAAAFGVPIPLPLGNR